MAVAALLFVPLGTWLATKIIRDDDRQVAAQAAQRDIAPGTWTAQITETRQPVSEGAKSISNTIGMKLVLISAGKFMMGSPKEEAGRLDTEEQHEVEIMQPFYMGMYTVTQVEYEMVIGQNPSYFSATGDGKDKVAGMNTSRFPVEMVTWNDAVAFCRKLSQLPAEQQAGRVYRLPTEAEWEYCCRAGTTTPFHFGNSLSSNQANTEGLHPYGGAKKGPNLLRPTTVGAYLPNAFGLYDMHGNVSQWCQDCFDANYYRNSPRQDPPGSTGDSQRVLRGGNCFQGCISCRSAARFSIAPRLQSNHLGFRVVCVR